ncbi:hypothetical protein [Pseudomonas phage Njord]|uniref:Uncharacterized protein n=1 Tax=Pseudomonas phage Njord TaxID=2163985 RepID=A0A2S1GMI8_9CAUD|nr:hypothetical protein HOT08_gp13 [Pseudomonas phage Njord]AWD90601.1 hypothetical protein [Pseudomonas phage Njord]
MLYKLVLLLEKMKQAAVDAAVKYERSKLEDAADAIDTAEELGEARCKWAWELYIKLHNRAVAKYQAQIKQCNAAKAESADRITHLQSL